VELKVQGDEVSGYRVFIKIPEAWRDAQSRTTVLQIAQTFGRVLLIGAGLITVLVISLRSLKNPEIAQVPWRRLAKWSAWVLVAAIIVFVNRAPQLLANYVTTWPLKTYYATLFISLLFLTALYLAAALLLLGLSWFFLERAFGRGHIPLWTGMRPEYYRDACCVALFGTAVVMELERLPELLAHWPLLRHMLAAAVPEGLDTISPAAGAIASGISGGFSIIGMVALVAALTKAYIRPLWMRVGLAVLAAVLMATNVATPGAFLRVAAFNLLMISVVWLGVARIVRFNVMGYFLFAVMIVLVPGAIELLKQPNAYFRANGYVVMAVAVGLLAWPLLLWLRGKAASRILV
jgi:hypothetical protein